MEFGSNWCGVGSVDCVRLDTPAGRVRGSVLTAKPATCQPPIPRPPLQPEFLPPDLDFGADSTWQDRLCGGRCSPALVHCTPGADASSALPAPPRHSTGLHQGVGGGGGILASQPAHTWPGAGESICADRPGQSTVPARLGQVGGAGTRPSHCPSVPVRPLNPIFSMCKGF